MKACLFVVLQAKAYALPDAQFCRCIHFSDGACVCEVAPCAWQAPKVVAACQAHGATRRVQATSPRSNIMLLQPHYLLAVHWLCYSSLLTPRPPPPSMSEARQIWCVCRKAPSVKTDVSSKGRPMPKAPARPWSNLSSALQPAGGVQDTYPPAQQAADVVKKNDLHREAIMAEGNLQQLLQQLADTQGIHVVPSCVVPCCAVPCYAMLGCSVWGCAMLFCGDV